MSEAAFYDRINTIYIKSFNLSWIKTKCLYLRKMEPLMTDSDIKSARVIRESNNKLQLTPCAPGVWSCLKSAKQQYNY